MEIQTQSKTTIKTTGYYDNGVLKTQDCEIGDHYGNEYCKEMDFNEVIRKVGLPNGRFNIVITLELDED